MSNREEKMRVMVRELLESGKIKYFIGYEGGSDAFYVSPCFISNPKDVDKLIFGPNCYSNLSNYILEEQKKVLKRGEEKDPRPIGIIVKGCDSRSIVQLMSENKIKAADVIILGVPCKGIIDPEKIEAVAKKMKIPGKALMGMKLAETSDGFIGEFDGKEYKFPKSDVTMDKCKVCMYPNPIISNELLDVEVEVTGKLDYSDIEKLEKMTPDEKWKFWESEMSKCIRCHACREVCPVCYCKECVVDPHNLVVSPKTQSKTKENKSMWIERSAELPENIFFHLTRMNHMFGRCTNCGECERVCPMGIRLSLLTKKIEKDAKELFNFESGVKKDEKPLLGVYKEGDPDDFIR